MYSVVSLSSRSLTNPPLIAGISIHIKIDSSSVLGLMSFIMLSYDIIASFDCSTLLRAAIYLLWLSIVISGISFDSWNLKSIFLTCWIFGSISWRDWIILSNDIFSVGYAWPGKFLVSPSEACPRSIIPGHHMVVCDLICCEWSHMCAICVFRNGCPSPTASVHTFNHQDAVHDSLWSCWPNNNKGHAGHQDAV